MARPERFERPTLRFVVVTGAYDGLLQSTLQLRIYLCFSLVNQRIIQQDRAPSYEARKTCRDANPGVNPE